MSATRTKRKRATGAQPGEFFRGQRTTYGIKTVRTVVPISKKAWQHIKANHANMTQSMYVNELLARGIRQENPNFSLVEGL